MRSATSSPRSSRSPPSSPRSSPTRRRRTWSSSRSSRSTSSSRSCPGEASVLIAAVLAGTGQLSITWVIVAADARRVRRATTSRTGSGGAPAGRSSSGCCAGIPSGSPRWRRASPTAAGRSSSSAASCPAGARPWPSARACCTSRGSASSPTTRSRPSCGVSRRRSRATSAGSCSPDRPWLGLVVGVATGSRSRSSSRRSGGHARRGGSASVRPSARRRRRRERGAGRAADARPPRASSPKPDEDLDGGDRHPGPDRAPQEAVVAEAEDRSRARGARRRPRPRRSRGARVASVCQPRRPKMTRYALVLESADERSIGRPPAGGASRRRRRARSVRPVTRSDRPR